MRLRSPQAVHWHGMHLPAKMDGGPHRMVPAGGSWTPEWTVAQSAASTLPTGQDPARSRFFELRLSGINDRRMDMARVDETVTRGTAETWTLRNRDGMPHNFHVRDVQFRVLDVNGQAPPPHLRGPKDAVFVPSGSTFRIAMRFDGPADPDTPTCTTAICSTTRTGE
ncbi:multicopper oxidase domain-containing protein [Streptomyces sp. NPDC054932]